MNTFDHERLDVYQVAMDFVALVNDVYGRERESARLKRDPTSRMIGS